MVNAAIDLQKGRDYITTGEKSMKMADMRQWGVGHWIVVGILCLALILLFARFRESPMFTGSKTTPLVTETAQAPAPDPEARLSAMEKTQAEILAILKQSAPKEPPATTPQGGNALPPTGQEGYGQQGDPRTQQQPQGGYGGQQASPPVDPNVARFNQMAPTRHTRKGDVNFQLNNLKIPEAGLNDCERRGGQIVPGPGHYDRRGHYVGKNICSVGGGNSGH